MNYEDDEALAMYHEDVQEYREKIRILETQLDFIKELRWEYEHALFEIRCAVDIRRKRIPLIREILDNYDISQIKDVL